MRSHRVYRAGAVSMTWSAVWLPADNIVYKIAVKREDQGRGVSRWIHKNLVLEATALASTSIVPLVEADRHVLVAG